MRLVRLALFAIVCCSTSVAAVLCIGQVVTPSHSAGITLAEGEVAVTHAEASVSKGPGHVTLERIPDDIAFRGATLNVKIPGTGFVIPLVDGKVTPVLIQEHPREVWRIHGMRFKSQNHDITRATRIEPSDARLDLILDGGDIWEVWTLDFADPKRGLRIRYRDGSGW